MATVFVSYRHRSSSELVGRLAANFAGTAVEVWRDVDNIGVGMSITAAVARGLQAANGAIVVFSADYLDSTACFLELAFLVTRLHGAQSSFPLLVFVPDGNLDRVMPTILSDGRSSTVTAEQGFDVAIAAFARAIQEASDRPVQPPAAHIARHFGGDALTTRLTVPCGHERAFWRLHDLLHPALAAQTRLALTRQTITVGSVAGGGAVDLALAYAEHLGACFQGGVFVLREYAATTRRQAQLREIGDVLGVPPEGLHANHLVSAVSGALSKRPPYLWILVRDSPPDHSGPGIRSEAPTPNGRTVIVLDSVLAEHEPHVTVGPLDRAAVARMFAGLFGLAVDNPAWSILHARSGGHLATLKALAALVEVAGLDLALARIGEMDEDELGCCAYRDAVLQLPLGARRTLLAFAALPAELVLPNNVIDALVKSAAKSPGEPAVVTHEHVVRLLKLGAMAQTQDRSGAFVAAGWREASLTLASNPELQASVLDMTRALEGNVRAVSSDLRPHVVKALLSVMPTDTRTRKNVRLPQLVSLAMQLLEQLESEDDCQLALRCSAIHALYGEHGAEQAILERALEWASAARGPDADLALEVMAELTMCPNLSPDKARRMLRDGLDRLSHDDPRVALRLRLAQRLAVIIGDVDAKSALDLLISSYERHRDDPDVLPLQHLRIRNSIGVFQTRQHGVQAAMATWQAALDLAIRAGLETSFDVVRLQANIASTLSRDDPERAAMMAHEVLDRQLQAFGIDHHLTLWAAVDALQYDLMAGRWDTARRLLESVLEPFRRQIRQARLGRAAGFAGQLERASAPPTWQRSHDYEAPLDAQALRHLERVQHIAVMTYESVVDARTPLRGAAELVSSTLTTLALMDLAGMGASNQFYLLDRLLRRRLWLRGVDWAALAPIMEGFYRRFAPAADRRWRTRFALRRLALAALKDPRPWDRLLIKRACRRVGLPFEAL